MIDDFAGLIADLSPEAVTWHEYPTATIDPLFGEKADGTPVDAADVVTLHPARRRQLMRLFDGAEHAVEPLAVYTTRAVSAGGESSAATEMTRALDGRRYQVIDVADYQAQGGVTIVLLSLLLDPS